MARQSKKLKEPQVPEMDAMLLEEQVDPVSGNTAPLGALPAEVRDDIDILVSPGEFVINAATVRYFGQEFFDSLQDTAEDGWERIASTGDLPFRDDELEFEEGDDAPKVGFAEGDIVEEGDGLSETEMTSIPTPIGGGYGGSGGTGASSSSYDFKVYSNAAGKEVRVYFYNGRPLTKIPEGYEEGGSADETVEEAVARVVEARDDDDKWARQAGVHSSSSPQEIFNAMGITKNGVDKSKGYWNTTPDTWTSSDWASYNKTIGGSFQIPGTDIKIDPAQAIMTGIVSTASGALGLALNYGLNVGKKKLAAKANASALSMIKTGKYGGSDPRTVLNTAYSTGVMLGTIKETAFEAWAKKTLDSQTIPEVNKNLMKQIRPMNKSIGLGWTSTLAGEQLYNAIDLHKRYTQDPSEGLAVTTSKGHVVGMIGSIGGGQAGMLADANGIALRDPNTNAVIRVDADGSTYVMSGMFGTTRIDIDKGTIKGAVDPSVSGNIVDDEVNYTVETPSGNQTSKAFDFDPMEDIGAAGTGDPYVLDVVEDDASTEDEGYGPYVPQDPDGGYSGPDIAPDIRTPDTGYDPYDPTKDPDPDQGDPRRTDTGPNPAAIARSQAASDQIGRDAASLGPRQTGNITIVNPDGSSVNRKTLDTEKVTESAKTNKVYGRAEGGLVSRPKKKKK